MHKPEEKLSGLAEAFDAARSAIPVRLNSANQQGSDRAAVKEYRSGKGKINIADGRHQKSGQALFMIRNSASITKSYASLCATEWKQLARPPAHSGRPDGRRYLVRSASIAVVTLR